MMNLARHLTILQPVISKISARVVVTRGLVYLAFVAGLAPGAMASPVMTPPELIALADFSRLVETHRNVTSSDETVGTLQLRDFLNNLETAHWFETGTVRIQIDRSLRSVQISLPQLRELYLTFIRDLSFGGGTINDLITAHPELRPGVEVILRTLLFRRDYLSINADRTGPDLWSITYPEPLNSVITPILRATAEDLEHSERIERRLFSLFGGLGLMTALELTSLTLQTTGHLEMSLNTSLASIPVLAIAGWAACETFLTVRAARR